MNNNLYNNEQALELFNNNLYLKKGFL